MRIWSPKLQFLKPHCLKLSYIVSIHIFEKKTITIFKTIRIMPLVTLQNSQLSNILHSKTNSSNIYDGSLLKALNIVIQIVFLQRITIS